MGFGQERALKTNRSPTPQTINLSICTSCGSRGWSPTTPHNVDTIAPTRTLQDTLSFPYKDDTQTKWGLSLGISVMNFFPFFFFVIFHCFSSFRGRVVSTSTLLRTFPSLTAPSSSFCLCCAMSRLITQRSFRVGIDGFSRRRRLCRRYTTYTKLHTWLHTVVVGATIGILFIFFDSFSLFFFFWLSSFSYTAGDNGITFLLLLWHFFCCFNLFTVTTFAKNYFFGYAISSLC